jgi:ParB family transcriptional regulator, chromosome partitioning protein
MSQPPRKALGRGLASLLAVEPEDLLHSQERILFIPTDKVVPGIYQPREYFDEVALQELAQSIKEHGILQPLLVVEQGDHYSLIAGERRLRATKLAGVDSVPCRILSLEDRQMLEIALLENIQRNDLNALEEAKGYQRLLDQFHYTQEKLAQRVGKSRSHVTNMLRLLGLPFEVQKMIAEDQISAGHAKVLLTCPNPQEMAQQILQNKLTVRDLEQKKNRLMKAVDVEEQALADQLSCLLEQPVKMKIKAKGGGVVSVSFEDAESLERFIERIHDAFSK